MLWIAPYELILASASAARRSVLASAELPFRIAPADIDERALEAKLAASGAGPRAVAEALAATKAETVAALNPAALVLGADQALECEGTSFSKPGSREAAKAQLLRLAGRTHFLHSALALRGPGEAWAFTETIAMAMRPLSPGSIEAYLEAAGDAVLSCVGAYQIEGLGAHLFDTVEGSHSGIMGLPLLPLLKRLREIKALAS